MSHPSLQLSVIIPAHNPRPASLGRVLAALAAQTLPPTHWELVMVDNGSQPPLDPGAGRPGHPAGRVIREDRVGLTAARLSGLAASGGEIVVLVDDDNVLAPDYLEQTLGLFAAHPKVGALGGKSQPEFAETPPTWTKEFHPLLALRDLGPAPLISRGLRPAGGARNGYPSFAPIGAGMALRRAVATAWCGARGREDAGISDRRGSELTSGGDNDIVLCAMHAGWEVAYFPGLVLTHLIPAGRLDAAYLARLNYGIQKSWMQVLSLHDANPWPSLPPASAALRRWKAWFTHRAWSSPVARIRWRGACGHFDGRIPR